MAIRTDVTVDWTVSPRVITVPTPSTEITVQDLYDTLAFLQADQLNLEWPRIVSAGGKEALGGSTSVAVTLTLIDAQITWGNRASNTVTKITGGNIVAIDTLGAELDVLLFSDKVNAFIAQSSSATVTDQGIREETRFLIESLRDNHFGWGHSYYWDPTNGDDANDGLLPTTPKLTFAAAKALTVAGSDIIYCLATNAGPTITTERLTLDVSGLIVRAPGGGVVTLLCPDGADPAVNITAANVEFTGFKISFSGTTVRTAIRVASTATNSLLRNITCAGGTGTGISYEGGLGHQVNRLIVAGYTVDGVVMTNCSNAYFTFVRMDANTGTGLKLVNSGAPGLCTLNSFANLAFAANGTAINIGADVYHSLFQVSCVIASSNTVALVDNGTGSYLQGPESIADIWADSKALSVGKFIALK